MSSGTETPNVFGSEYASVYDSLYQEKNYALECDIFEQATGLAGRAARILDVGCGTGGHSIELTKRGHTVTGVDMSAEMIALAKQKATARLDANQQPAFLQGSAADFVAPAKPFDAVLMMFAVLGYLQRNADIMDALSNINTHMKIGGLFIADFWWGPAVLSQRPGERVRVFDGPSGKAVRATKTSLETLNNLAKVHFDLLGAGKGEGVAHSSELHVMRYFFGPELDFMFAQAGFEIIKLTRFPDIDLPPDDQSWNAMLLARKMKEAAQT